LKDPTVPLSENKIYQRREQPKGILRWDVEVPAAATGEKAKAVEYGYLVEYDRKFRVSTGSAAALPAAQQEFQELQKARVFNQ
jgi:Zn-dependent M32 family carboxypeptidase